MKRTLIAAVAGFIAAQAANPAASQAYPDKYIRVVTGGIGGGVDFQARFIAQELTPNLGQSMIVDNRGNGLIPGEIVAKAPPDGYTLLVAGDIHLVGPFLQEAHYDPVNDFSPITCLTRAPIVLVVHPTLPVNSVKELIALARTKPGTLNYASSAAGATTHLAAELFKAMAGVNVVRVYYKDGATQMTDLISGQVQLTFGTAPVVGPHVHSGRLRALAVTTAQPSPLVPGLPTIAASGLPGYESEVMNGAFAPAKTPVAIVGFLNQKIVQALKNPQARERLAKVGVEPVGSSPEEFGAQVRGEIARYGKLIKDIGIKAD